MGSDSTDGGAGAEEHESSIATGVIWGYKCPYKGYRSNWRDRAFSGL